MGTRRELVDGITPDHLPREVVTNLLERGAPSTQSGQKVAGRAKPRTEQGDQPSSTSHVRRPIRAALVPVSVRLDAGVADALKCASLQRQLAGEVPNTQQDIVAHVLQPWLRSQGYLTDE